MGDDTGSLNEPAKSMAEHAVDMGLKITSTRRDKQSQAHAMATNVVKNHQWIAETYAAGEVKDALQKWVDENDSEASEVASCAAGLLEVMNNFSDEDLRHLSWHLSGNAFDCQPGVGEIGVLRHLVAHANKLYGAGSAKLLEHEGGLVRWHVQVHTGSQADEDHNYKTDFDDID